MSTTVVEGPRSITRRRGGSRRNRRYSADRWGTDQADRYTDEIREACRGLVSGAKRGRSVDVRRGYMKCAAGVHMIYFRDHADRVDVVRILHQRQDASRNLPN